MSAVEYRTVTIPALNEHDGYYSMDLTIPWTCIVCGGPRGEPFKTTSWDGSRQLQVDGWENPCGHVEKYSSIRAWLAAQAEERRARGLAFDAAIFPERLEQENAGARLADDHFCQGCGQRGVRGRYCRTCESGSVSASTARHLLVLAIAAATFMAVLP